jgi:hypothetical protein
MPPKPPPKRPRVSSYGGSRPAGEADAERDKGPGAGTAATAADWQIGGGLLLSGTVEADAGLATSLSLTDKPSSMKQLCLDVQTDVARARAYRPIPDPDAQAAWTEALSNFASGAEDCVSAVDKNDAALSSKAADELYRGINLSTRVDGRLKQLGA